MTKLIMGAQHTKVLQMNDHKKIKESKKTNQRDNKTQKEQSIQGQSHLHLPVSMSSNNVNENHFQIQLNNIVMAGQLLKKQKLILKTRPNLKIISMIYVRQRTLQQLIINDCDKNVVIFFNKTKDILFFKFIKAQRYELAKNQSEQTIWIFVEDINNQNVMLEGCFHDFQTYFTGVVPPTSIHCDASINITQAQCRQNNEEDEYLNETNNQICFPLPTQQILKQSNEVRGSIVELKDADKQQILLDIFKIKKMDKSHNPQLQCPIHSCHKSYKNVVQMRNHLQKHTELDKYGVTINQSQQFQFNKKALNFVLFLGYLYPHQMKKIIKKMKTIPTSI